MRIANTANADLNSEGRSSQPMDSTETAMNVRLPNAVFTPEPRQNQLRFSRRTQSVHQAPNQINQLKMKPMKVQPVLRRKKRSVDAALPRIPQRPRLMLNDLESIIDEEILMGKRVQDKPVAVLPETRIDALMNHRKKSLMTKQLSPIQRFNIELICSKKNGIIGKMPVGMNYRFKSDANQSRKQLNVTKSALMQKVASSRNFAQPMSNQIKSFHDKVRANEINQEVLSNLFAKNDELKAQYMNDKLSSEDVASIHDMERKQEMEKKARLTAYASSLKGVETFDKLPMTSNEAGKRGDLSESPHNKTVSDGFTKVVSLKDAVDQTMQALSKESIDLRATLQAKSKDEMKLTSSFHPNSSGRKSQHLQSPFEQQMQTTPDLSQAYSQTGGRNKKINWTMTVPSMLRTFQTRSPRKESEGQSRLSDQDKRDEVLRERLMTLQQKHGKGSVERSQEADSKSPPPLSTRFPQLLLNEPSHVSLKIIQESAQPQIKQNLKVPVFATTTSSPFLDRSKVHFGVSKISEFSNQTSKKAKSTFRQNISFQKSSSSMFKQVAIKHKHLRHQSPIEKTIPRDFSVPKHVAYLFEPAQEKYGNYKNPEKRKDTESQNDTKYNRVRIAVDRMYSAYQ